MGRTKKNTRWITTEVEIPIAVRFGELAKARGISMRQALRRVLLDAIIKDQIPGVDQMDLEHREHEKWGTATPTFENPPEQRTSGHRIAPVPPSD